MKEYIERVHQLDSRVIQAYSQLRPTKGTTRRLFWLGASQHCSFLRPGLSFNQSERPVFPIIEVVLSTIAGRGAKESTDSGFPTSSDCSSNTCWQRNKPVPTASTITPPTEEEGEGRSTLSGISRRTSTSSSVSGSCPRSVCCCAGRRLLLPSMELSYLLGS